MTKKDDRRISSMHKKARKVAGGRVVNSKQRRKEIVRSGGYKRIFISDGGKMKRMNN